jgi:hypothetical protein
MVIEQRRESGHHLMLIAVSSFGESLRRQHLTQPAEALFNGITPHFWMTVYQFLAT